VLRSGKRPSAERSWFRHRRAPFGESTILTSNAARVDIRWSEKLQSNDNTNNRERKEVASNRVASKYANPRTVLLTSRKIPVPPLVPSPLHPRPPENQLQHRHHEPPKLPVHRTSTLPNMSVHLAPHHGKSPAAFVRTFWSHWPRSANSVSQSMRSPYKAYKSPFGPQYVLHFRFRATV
jgi:hypothetical protein